MLLTCSILKCHEYFQPITYEMCSVQQRACFESFCVVFCLESVSEDTGWNFNYTPLEFIHTLLTRMNWVLCAAIFSFRDFNCGRVLYKFCTNKVNDVDQLWGPALLDIGSWHKNVSLTHFMIPGLLSLCLTFELIWAQTFPVEILAIKK